MWGKEGAFEGAFFYCRDVAVDFAGNVYITDEINNRVQKFDSRGNFLAKWGKEGNGPGQFNGPWGIAVDALGNVYVTDTRSEEHTSELQSLRHLVCRLLLEKKKNRT